MKRALLIRNILTGNSNAVGVAGEHIARQAIRRYAPTKNTSKLGHSGDANISGVSVEIKTATSNRKGQYKASLYKRDKYGYSDFRVSAYVLFQLITDSGRIVLYLIPTIVLFELIWIRFLMTKAGKHLRPYIIAILKKNNN